MPTRGQDPGACAPAVSENLPSVKKPLNPDSENDYRKKGESREVDGNDGQADDEPRWTAKEWAEWHKQK